MDTPYDPNEPTGVKLARLETKVDALLAGNADHERRIRTVEKSLWTFAGAASLLGAVLSFFATKLTFHA